MKARGVSQGVTAFFLARSVSEGDKKMETCDIEEALTH
jgi:hypothetical protein